MRSTADPVAAFVMRATVVAPTDNAADPRPRPPDAPGAYGLSQTADGAVDARPGASEA
ncbi:hypothetical protein SSPO_060150 [Streptomyces antimycoticus]|uniref:Uncharacterized protein n=1 Tax=Streptomyces antimycoticus TaxID=68175 RepID=A0A499VAZ0_9ACTN|nr:hypothetical protein SSPO_060150 [Streptomyces antimycoticus]